MWHCISGLESIVYLDQYQKMALQTANIEELQIPPIVYCAMGLAGESGEVCEKIKKLYRDKQGQIDFKDKEALSKELGDVLWYVATLAHYAGLSLHNIADLNLAKLASRKLRNKIQGEGDNR